MPALSSRSERVPESPFRKLARLGEAVKAKGTKVIHLNIGQPDIPTPSKALLRFKENLPSIVAYNPGIGGLHYRTQLCHYYNRFGVSLTPDHLMITAGASEALQLLFYALADPGENFLTPEPFYANFQGFAEVAGVQLVGVPADPTNGFALPSIAEFEDKYTSGTKGILLNVPGNPTGSCYDPKQVKALLEWAVEKDLFIIVDEVYREFVYDGRSPFCSLGWGIAKDHLVVIDSISKRYSACGARIGNIASFNKSLLETLGKYGKLRLSPPALGEQLAGYILDEEGNYLQEVVAEYDARRMLVYQRLSVMDGVETYLPGGAFYCFAKLPVDDGEAFCRFLLESFQYDGATVMLSPGAAFHQDANKGKKMVRIAFVKNQAALSQAMDILEHGLIAYAKVSLEPQTVHQ